MVFRKGRGCPGGRSGQEGEKGKRRPALYGCHFYLGSGNSLIVSVGRQVGDGWIRCIHGGVAHGCAGTDVWALVLLDNAGTPPVLL